MQAKHRVGSTIFGLAVGLLVAWFSYQWITDESKRVERTEQERVVQHAREILVDRLGLTGSEFVDPLAPKRPVGKVYIYPLADGWEISGFYRRNEADSWHPYLMELAATLELRSLRIKDPLLSQRAVDDPLLEVAN